MSTTPTEYEVESGPGLPRWATILLVLMVLVVAGLAYAQFGSGVSGQLKQISNQLARLDARTASLEDNYAGLKGQMEVAGERLGLTQKELQRARALSNQIREQQKAVAALDTELDTFRSEQQAQLGSLSGEVTTVKTGLEATSRALSETQSKLERAIGDMGVQSGLIAKNSGELEELRRRGDRNYFEFDLRKVKNFTRVGTISIKLNRTDPKRQRYTITVLANDKSIEKKDKTLLEPVQFYLQGTRHMLELVVYTIDRDRVAGYLSTPKELASR